MSEKNVMKKINILVEQQKNDIYNWDLYNTVKRIKESFLDFSKNKLSLSKEQQKNELKKISETIPSTLRIVYHYRENCNPCKEQKKIWREVLNKVFEKKKVTVLEILKTEQDGVDTYPCNKIYTEDGKMHMFRYDPEFKERNVETLSTFFLKHI